MQFDHLAGVASLFMVMHPTKLLSMVNAAEWVRETALGICAGALLCGSGEIPVENRLFPSLVPAVVMGLCLGDDHC